MEHRTTGYALGGLLIGVGVALAGYFIGNGFLQARAADRFVTVKGLSEREVAADLVLWPIVYTVTAEDLETLQRRIDDGAGKIKDFLGDNFAPDEVTMSAPRVTDRQAQGMTDQYGRLERYTAEATVIVRTGKIDAARAAMERSGALVKQGVALIRSYEYQTQYLFTGLDAIKPEMIAEATRDARRAAEQFAEDSGSRAGGIRNAQQGYFSIEDRDPFSPEFKNVRVVTTVQFFLEDD
jgi:hypothetical protein